MTPEQELDLHMAEPQADGNVIFFKVAFPDSPKTYSYAGIKIAGRWYLTGRDFRESGQTWLEFIAWLVSRDMTVVEIRRATEWENL